MWDPIVELKKPGALSVRRLGKMMEILVCNLLAVKFDSKTSTEMTSEVIHGLFVTYLMFESAESQGDVTGCGV